MRFARIFWTLSLFASSGPLAAQARRTDSETLVRAFLTAQEAMMQDGAGEAQLRAVTAFLSDSVVYDHPRAGAHLLGKGIITDGFQGFLGSTRLARITVLSLVASPAVVVVEANVSFEVRDTAGWAPYARTQISVFEVARGRITHVVELWQPH
jgi:SnoaL-like domain